MSTLIQNSDHGQLFENAAERILTYIFRQEQADRSSPIVWGLCGGRSPQGLFSTLLPKLCELPRDVCSRFRFFQVDERLFQERNFDLLSTQFIGPLLDAKKISQDQIFSFPLRKDLVEAKQTAETYLHALNSFGGKFHICILGAGEDGHVAGAFPHHAASEEVSAKFVVFHESPKPPMGRVSASLALLERSDFGVLLALGEGKRKALSDCLNPSISLLDCPAKVIFKMKEKIILSDLLES